MSSDQTYVSSSRMSMLSRCGIQYDFRYNQRIKSPPGVAMLVGRSVDHSVTKNLEPVVDGGVPLGEEAAKDLARDKMGVEWSASEVKLLPEEEPKKALGSAVDKSVRLASLHATRIAPSLKPTSLQRGFEIDLEPQGFPAVVIGYLDMEEGDKTIRDTKTSGKTPTKNAADVSPQLDLYATAKLALDGVLPKEVVLDYLIDLKTPKTLTLSRAVDRSAVDRSLMRVENFLTVIEAGAFVPASPTDWCCSERWCGYWQICPYAARPVFVAT